MATLKQPYSNLSQQQLDMTAQQPLNSSADSYYYNTFYDNTNSLINNDCMESPSKKMKYNNEDDYEQQQSKQSIMKLINQQQQNDNQILVNNNQDNNLNNKNEQLSALKPFQLLNQNGLMNNTETMTSNYSSFHQQAPSPYHHNHPLHHAHNYHHHQNRFNNEFYVDHHHHHHQSSLIKALEATPVAATSQLSSAGYTTTDYMFKYEKQEGNGSAMHNTNTHHSLTDGDDEEEDDYDDEEDFDDEDDDATNTNSNSHYEYECEDKNSTNTNTNNYTNLNSTANNCEINAYGNSVFDSPLSLSTQNEDAPHLTTLTTARQQQQQQHHAKNNVNLTKTSPIPPAPLQSTSTITNLLNVKNEHSEQLGNNKTMTSSIVVTKLPENIATDTNSLKKSVHHFNNCTLNDYELISLPLRELNKRLRYVPKMTAIDLKKRRRTLKNRKYAQNCRSKRLEQKCEMELQNIKLKSDIGRLNKLIDKYQREMQMYKAYVEELLKQDSSRLTTTTPTMTSKQPSFLFDNSELTGVVVEHQTSSTNSSNSQTNNNCYLIN